MSGISLKRITRLFPNVHELHTGVEERLRGWRGGVWVVTLKNCVECLKLRKAEVDWKIWCKRLFVMFRLLFVRRRQRPSRMPMDGRELKYSSVVLECYSRALA